MRYFLVNFLFLSSVSVLATDGWVALSDCRQKAYATVKQYVMLVSVLGRDPRQDCMVSIQYRSTYPEFVRYLSVREDGLFTVSDQLGKKKIESYAFFIVSRYRGERIKYRVQGDSVEIVGPSFNPITVSVTDPMFRSDDFAVLTKPSSKRPLWEQKEKLEVQALGAVYALELGYSTKDSPAKMLMGSNANQKVLKLRSRDLKQQCLLAPSKVLKKTKVKDDYTLLDDLQLTNRLMEDCKDFNINFLHPEPTIQRLADPNGAP